MGTEQNQQLADTLEELRQFIPRLIRAAIELSDRFYAPMNDDTWSLLGDVLQAMDDLYRTAQTISTQFGEMHHFSVNGWDMQEFSLKLNGEFQRMNQCTDQEDYVGAGDIFKFELIPPSSAVVASTR
ncbi:hypothetical protein [Cohnella rhizosphaerae]|uniref:Uncharacterized protein n=1 Tax=Cohnella rhizosphaerae TaxID=1457232 RepID=A0A9X4QUM0_9BACL|nr:hypothetical protein [Cohnella rhizosphaerae]MDG0811870.1 hypothetical protein [Cohnella rhizosphaerae]